MQFWYYGTTIPDLFAWADVSSQCVVVLHRAVVQYLKSKAQSQKSKNTGGGIAPPLRLLVGAVAKVKRLKSVVRIAIGQTFRASLSRDGHLRHELAKVSRSAASQY